MSCWKLSFLWPKSTPGESQLFVAIVLGYRRVLDKRKVRWQPHLFNKILNVKTQSLSEIPLNVSAPRPMTWDIRVKVAGPLYLRFLSLDSANGECDHFAVYEDRICAAAGEDRAKRAPDENSIGLTTVSLENLFDTLSWEIENLLCHRKAVYRFG